MDYLLVYGCQLDGVRGEGNAPISGGPEQSELSIKHIRAWERMIQEGGGLDFVVLRNIIPLPGDVK